MKLYFVIALTLGLFVDYALNEGNEPFSVIKRIASRIVEGAPLALDGNIVWSCPAELQNDQKYVELLAKHQSYIYGYCLFQKLFFVNQPKSCTEQVKPILQARIDEESGMLLQCGPKSKHLFYRFGFLFCGAVETLRQLEDVKLQEEIERFHLPAQFIFTFNLCVNTKNGLAVWTRHHITTPKLFPKENNDEKPDSVISVDALAFKKEYYERIQNKYANQEGKKFKMNANSMVPKDHMSSKLWQKVANHYIIAAPLWDQLQKLMNAINESIKKLHFILRAQNKSLNIYTKVVNLSGWTYRKAGSMAFSQNAWYKLLYLKKQQTAVLIILQNTPEMPPGANTTLCRIRIHCSMRAWFNKLGKFGDDIPDEYLQYAFCCKPTQAEAFKLFDLGLHIVEILKIDELLTDDLLTKKVTNQRIIHIPVA